MLSALVVQIVEERDGLRELDPLRRAHDPNRHRILVVDGQIGRYVRRIFDGPSELEHLLERDDLGILQHARFVRAVHEVLVTRVRLVDGRLHRDRVERRILQQIASPLKAGEEVGVLPRSDDFEVRGERREGQFEPDLIVSFPRGTVRDGPGTLRPRNFDLTARDHGSGERRTEQVSILVHGIPRDRGEDELRDEVLLQILDEDLRRTRRLRALGDVIEVLLLTHVGDVGDHLVSPLLQVFQDARGVESSTVREDHLLLRHLVVPV